MLLDTNALFLAATRGFPLRAEIGRLLPDAVPVVPSPVLGELDRLVERGEIGATLARALAARFPVVRGSGRGDGGVLEIAQRLGATVVTADGRFQARLVAAGVPVMVPRDRARLEFRPGATRRVPSPAPPGRALPTRARQLL